MSYFYTVFFCLFYCLINLHQNSTLASEKASSINDSKSTNNGDEEDSVYLIAGGYIPEKHFLAKYVVSIREKLELSNKYADYFGATHICGGSILSPNRILTAAHCVILDGEISSPSSLIVVASTPKRLDKTQHSQIFHVDSVMPHSNYNEKTLMYDIALLRLKTKIVLHNNHADVIPLPQGPLATGTECVALGWGSMYTDGPFANDILYVNLTVVADKICRKKIKQFNYGEICAFNFKNPEMDSCQGDSGGPLICNGSVSGIVSFGFDCGTGLPAIYTDVYEFLDWIRRSKCGKQSTCLWLLLLLFSLIWVTM